MEFPKRTDKHIKESAGWRLLQAKTPSEWLIREITERDYGIDAYIEIVSSSGKVSGDLCSIQLKSSESIKWNGKNAKLCGIKKTTVNYWMNLPVPVFMIWADIEASKIYFCAVKEQVRKYFSHYKDNNKSMTFRFSRSCELGSDVGNLIFLYLYYREKRFHEFIGYLSDLLLHCEEYYDYIICNQGRDYFLGVEDESLFTMLHIYRSCKFLAQYFDVKWEVIDLAEAFKKDKEIWKDPYYLMHEMTLSKILEDLQIVFIEIIKKAKRLIINEQKDYWEKNNLIFYSKCMNLNIDDMVRKYE